MKSRRLILFLVIQSVLMTAVLAAQTPPARNEYVLAESGNLKAVIKVKNSATLADTDWLQVEITNSGPAGRIKSASIKAPEYENGELRSSDIFQLATIGNRTSPRSPFTYDLPFGTYTVQDPQMSAGNILRIPAVPQDVELRVSLSLTLVDGRALATFDPVTVKFTWLPPDAAQLDTLQKRTVALLDRAVNYRSATGEPPAEITFLGILLKNPQTSQAITLDQALTALKRRQIAVGGSLRSLDLPGFVNTRWGKDPEAIAFYRDALTTSGPEALYDLVEGSMWDDSFIEPLIRVVETVAANPPRPFSSILLQAAIPSGIQELDRHYSSWSQDASIPPRLSRAVLLAHPVLTSSAAATAEFTAVRPSLPLFTSRETFYDAVNLLARTHDRGMINVLRSFLNNQTVDPFISESTGTVIVQPFGTPLRLCDVAANGISILLGEPDMFDRYKGASAPRGGPYPQWTEWDMQIAALQKRLDAMPKP